MPSSPPPDRFQREIDDIIRLAERRLEHQSFSYRMRRSTRRLGNAFGGFSLRLPPPETLGGWALALLLISWLLTLPIVSGVLLRTVALFSSLMRGGGGGLGGKMGRGGPLSYGPPCGDSCPNRLRRFFR